MQEHHKKAVQRDTWNLLLDFSRTVKDDLSDYDADGMPRHHGNRACWQPPVIMTEAFRNENSSMLHTAGPMAPSLKG